jgi:hypothetical protein
MKVGSKVEKIKGYKWPGIIVASFRNLGNEPRYVVECTVPEVAGALHIYSPEQLKEQEQMSKEQEVKFDSKSVDWLAKALDTANDEDVVMATFQHNRKLTVRALKYAAFTLRHYEERLQGNPPKSR